MVMLTLFDDFKSVFAWFLKLEQDFVLYFFFECLPGDSDLSAGDESVLWEDLFSVSGDEGGGGGEGTCCGPEGDVPVSFVSSDERDVDAREIGGGIVELINFLLLSVYVCLYLSLV